MTQGGEGAEDQNERNKKRRWLLVLIVVIVLGTVGFFVYRSAADSGVMGKNGDAELGVSPDMSEDQAQQQRNAAVSEGMKHVSINPHSLFESGSAMGNLGIENTAQSHYSYVVSIMRDDTGDEVYKSGLLKPGYYIDKARLSKSLPKGDYSATARFVAYKESGGEPIGAAVVKIIITVKS